MKLLLCIPYFASSFPTAAVESLDLIPERVPTAAHAEMINPILPTEIVNRIYEYEPILKYFILGETHGLTVTPEKYMYDWKYKECIKNKHTIILDKPYGVVARCVCGKTQCFNWRK